MLLTPNLRLRAVEHTDLNALFRGNGYKASARPVDRALALVEDDGTLAAATRLSLSPHCSTLGEVHALRNLCVAREWRRRGLGTRLARLASEGKLCYCYCFAELVPLYRAAGFIESDAHAVPPWVRDGFEKVAAQQQRKGRPVRLMTRGFPLSVVLLQHANEQRRPTATGPLLADASLAAHVHVERWSWSGRADNERLERALRQLAAPRLLWTDGAGAAAGRDEAAAAPAAAAPAAAAPVASTHVVLDGTWQEARALFRKGPAALRAMPRRALAPRRESAFVLRGDFGWRERFGGAAGAQLCCTAEVGALLLDETGDETGSERLRRLLDEHQADYAMRHPHLHHKVRRAAAEGPTAGEGSDG